MFEQSCINPPKNTPRVVFWWWACLDSNQEPIAYKAIALPLSYMPAPGCLFYRGRRFLRVWFFRARAFYDSLEFFPFNCFSFDEDLSDFIELRPLFRDNSVRFFLRLVKNAFYLLVNDPCCFFRVIFFC